jgi:hypothetical protein
MMKGDQKIIREANIAIFFDELEKLIKSEWYIKTIIADKEYTSYALVEKK